MAIVVSPPIDAMSSSRPVIWIASILTGADIQYAQVKLYDATGTLLVTFQQPIKIVVFGFIFVINIQTQIANLLAPNSQNITSVFTENPQDAHVELNSDCYKGVYIEVEYFYKTPSDIILNLGVTDTSNVVSVFAATRQQYEPYLLDQYLPTFGYGYKPLSKRPFGKAKVSGENGFFLSLIMNDTLNALLVTTFDKDGVAIEQGLKFLPTDTDSPFWQITVGLGLTQLAAITWDFDGITVTGNERKALIQFVFAIPIGSSYIFTENTREFINYDPLGCGVNNIQIHFLNSLGGADSYEFSHNEYERTYTVERELGQKPSSYNALTGNYFSYSDKGRFVQNAKALTRYIVETTEEDVIIGWLAEVAISPEVFLALRNYQQSFLSPVILETTDVLISTVRGERKQVFIFSSSHYQNTLQH